MQRLIGLIALLGAGWIIWRQLPSPGTALPDPSSSGVMSPMSDRTPRGIRNNNPGNLKESGEWVGNVGNDAQGFEIFDTPINGLRALFINLRNQARKHGLSTVAGVLTKWDAANAIPYIAMVTLRTGFQPYQTINLEDRNVLRSVGIAIIEMENGSQPYGVAQIEAGLTAAGY